MSFFDKLMEADTDSIETITYGRALIGACFIGYLVKKYLGENDKEFQRNQQLKQRL